MHFALLDNSCREYLFVADFFMAQNNAAKDLFTAVFGKTLSLFLVSSADFHQATNFGFRLCMCTRMQLLGQAEVMRLILRQQKQMDTYLESCFDAIGIFLCIHIVHRYRILMHKRSVPALDK